jgi:hypothetical protein
MPETKEEDDRAEDDKAKEWASKTTREERTGKKA